MDVEIAEDLAGGEVIETGNLPQDFALGAFAGARGAEEQNGLVAVRHRHGLHRDNRRYTPGRGT
jgi:hypothetical protein